MPPAGIGRHEGAPPLPQHIRLYFIALVTAPYRMTSAQRPRRCVILRRHKAAAANIHSTLAVRARRSIRFPIAHDFFVFVATVAAHDYSGRFTFGSVIRSQAIRLMVAGPLCSRSQQNHAKAIALPDLFPSHPPRCIMGKRFLNTSTLARLPPSNIAVRRLLSKKASRRSMMTRGHSSRPRSTNSPASLNGGLVMIAWVSGGALRSIRKSMPLWLLGQR